MSGPLTDDPAFNVVSPTGANNSHAYAAPEERFAIVGIGASAGGLESCGGLDQALPRAALASSSAAK